MPFVDKPTRAIIHQWRRCRDRNVLPESGGLFDQSELVMQLFDVIDNAVAKHQKDQMDAAESKSRSAEALRKLQHGH